MASATKRRRSLGGWLLLALVLAAAAVASDRSTPVAAHALLVRADPPVNAQLRSGEVPAVFTLYFSEALERAFSDSAFSTPTALKPLTASSSTIVTTR